MIILVSLVAWLVRELSGQFDTTFNTILFFTSVVLVSFGWFMLAYIDRRLNEVYPYERSIPGRIAIQLSLGAVLGVLIRFLIYQFGEPNLPFRLDSLFLAATWALSH